MSPDQIRIFRTRARAKGFSEMQINQEIARKQQEETRLQLQRSQQDQQPMAQVEQPMVAGDVVTKTVPEKRTVGGLFKNAITDVVDFAVNTPIQTAKSIAAVGFEGARALSSGVDQNRVEKKRKELEAATRAFKAEKDPTKQKQLVAKSRLIAKELEQLTGGLKKSEKQNPFVKPEELPSSQGELAGGILKNVGRTFGLVQDEEGNIVFDLETAIQSAYEKPVTTALLAKDLGSSGLKKVTSKGVVKQTTQKVAGKPGIFEKAGEGLRKEVLNPKGNASPFVSEEMAALQKVQKELGLKGSAKAQLEQLPEAFRKSQTTIESLLKKAENTKQGKLSDEFLRQVDEANYGLDDLQFSKAVEAEINILKDLDGMSPLAQYKQLEKYRDLLKSTRKKLDRGTTLLPKEEARLAAFNALKASIDSVSPEVRVLNTLQNQMYNISEGLLKSTKKKGIGAGPFRLPTGVSQNIEDFAGRNAAGLDTVVGTPGKMVSGTLKRLPKVSPGTGVAMSLSSGSLVPPIDQQAEDTGSQPEDYGQDDEYDYQEINQDDSIIGSHPIFGNLSKQEVLLEAFKSGLNQKQLKEIEAFYDQFASTEDEEQLSDTFLDTGKPVTRADKMWMLENPDKVPGAAGKPKLTEKERMFQNAGTAAQQALDLLEGGSVASGIGQGTLGSIGEKLGTNSKEQQRYRSSLALARTAARNALLGANMTPAEMESISAFIPQFGDAPEIAKEKLSTFIDLMNQFSGLGNLNAAEEETNDDVKKKPLGSTESKPQNNALSGLVEGVSGLLSKVSGNVSAAEEGKEISNIKIEGDMVVTEYADGGTKYEDIDKNLSVLQKFGGLLNDIGTKYNLKELNLSEALGYKSKKERIAKLMEYKDMIDKQVRSGKREPVAGEPMQQPKGGKTQQGEVKSVKTEKPITDSSGRNSSAKKASEVHSSSISAIDKAADKYNVPRDLLRDIAFSESSFEADNSARKGGLDSSAAGLFMFIDDTWKETMKAMGKPASTSKYDPQANAEAAAYLISKGQLGRWEASKHNWGRFYSEDELKPFDSRKQ